MGKIIFPYIHAAVSILCHSSGFFQVGPASLEAVRRGQVQLPYDVPFVLAEVNADLVRWQKDETAKNGFKKLSSHKSQ